MKKTLKKRAARKGRARNARGDKANSAATGKARAEGLRLFALAGKPKKSDFVRVFGKKGPAWTWEARAKALGVASAEECAAKFQSLLAKASH